MRVEPNLDFNIANLVYYSSSWQYILILSFNVTLHKPLSGKVITIPSTG